MRIFCRHPCDHADVYEAFERRFSTLHNRIIALELEQDTFRNKVLRKIQGKKTEESEEPKDLYGGMLLSE